MIRSLFGGSALLVLVALASLTWGQGGSPGTKPAERPITLTVQEAGKQPQVCQILQVWTAADGSRGYQVEALDTGERMTVLETAPVTARDGNALRTASTRVFRYGTSIAPPPGVPAPPANATVLAAPIRSTPSPYLAPTFKTAEPGKTDDWRQSWGHIERVRTDDQLPRTNGIPNLPVAKKQDDPLQQPGLYTRTPPRMDKLIGAPGQTTATLAGQTNPAPRQAATIVSVPSGTAPVLPAAIPIKKEEPRGLAALFAPRPRATIPTGNPVATNPTASTQTPTPAGTVVNRPANPYSQSLAYLPASAPLTTPPFVTPIPTVSVPPTQPALAPTQLAPTPLAPTPLAPLPPAEPGRASAISPPEVPAIKPIPAHRILTAPPAFARQAPPPQPEHEDKLGLLGRSLPPAGSMSILAVNSRELRQLPQPTPGPDGRLLAPPSNAFAPPVVMESNNLPEGMANAFTAAGNGRPIPADMMRKDLMPPELVAMLEGRYRPKNGPGGPFDPPALPADPRLALAQAQAPLPARTPAPVPQPALVQAPAPAPAPMRAAAPTPIRQVSGAAILGQLHAVLRDGLLPSEREQAADQLARYEAQRDPEAVEALLTGAKSDPAVTVRIACVRGLGTMRATSPPVVASLRAMSREGDERVRTTCTEVLALLGVKK